MRKKMWLSAAILPASLLAFCWTATAASVDCTNATITCNTFTKGTAQFKPVLSTGAVGTCAAGGGVEVISIKGTVSDCTVTGAGGVKVISGSVKGTLYTGDCTCAGLAVSPNPIIVPPAGKFNQLVTSWKFDTTAPDVCNSGQKASTLALVGGVAGITSGPFIASLANANFNPGAVYGAFTLKAPGTGVAGIFQGADLGATSHTTGATTESLSTLFNTCAGAKGLKGITFGQADTVLQ